ncbi:hypothetical protein ES705_46407 [subsurface metagenome]
MKLEDLLKKRPFVYHLTDARNINLISKHKEILSYKALLDLTNESVEDKETLLSEKRDNHKMVEINGDTYHVRDY